MAINKEELYSGNEPPEKGVNKNLLYESSSQLEDRLIAPNYEKDLGTSNVNVDEYKDYFSAGVFDQPGLNDNRANNQGTVEKVVNGVTRLVGTTVTKTLEGVGYVGGFIDYGVNGFDDISKMTDNGFSAAFNALEEDIKDFAPIYTPSTVTEGGLLNKISSVSWWMDQGVDGAAFAISALVPGMLETKVLKLGSKVAGALGKGAKLANNIDIATITVYNTVSESAVEAKEIQDNIRNHYKDQIEQGLISTEEVELKAATAARNAFVLNLGVLLGPNLIQSKLFFGGPKESTVIGKLFNAEGQLIENAGVLTRKQAWNNILKQTGLGILREGFFEENIQLSIQNYEEALAKGNTEDKRISSLIKGMYDNLFTDEGQESIFLGGFLGGIMGGAGAAINNKRENTIINRAKEYMKENINQYSDTLRNKLNEVYIKDNDNNIVLDDKGNPKIDQNKVSEFLSELAKKSQTEAVKHAALLAGNKDLYEHIKNNEFTSFAIPFLEQEGGLDILNNQINNFSQIELEESKKTQDLLGSEILTIEEIKNNYKNKAKYLNDTINSIKNRTFTWNFTKSNKEFKNFENWLNTYQRNLAYLSSQTNFYRDQAKKARIEYMKVFSNITNSNLDYNTERNNLTAEEKRIESFYKKREEYYTNLFNEADKKYEQLSSKNNAKEEYLKYLDNKNKQEVEEEKEKVEEEIIEDQSKQDDLINKNEIIEFSKKLNKLNTNNQEEVDNFISEVNSSTLSESQKKDLIDSTKTPTYTEDDVVEELDLSDITGSKAKENKKQNEDSVEEDDYTSYNPYPEEVKDKIQHDEDNLEVEEEKAINKGFNSNVFSLAMNLIEYTKSKSGNFSRSGNPDPNFDIRLFDPEFIKEGDELILSIDINNEFYEQYKNDINNIPIAVYSNKDNKDNRKPIGYIHTVNWYLNSDIDQNVKNDLIEEVKEFRNKIYQNRNADNSQLYYTIKVIDKSNGKLNKIETKHSIFELSDSPNIIIANSAISTTNNPDEDVQTVNLMIKGLPYVLITLPNGKKFAKHLNTNKIKDTKNGEEITNTIYNLINTYYNNRSILKEFNITDDKSLLKEINKYVYAGYKTSRVDIRKQFYNKGKIWYIAGKPFDFNDKIDINQFKSVLGEMYIGINSKYLQDDKIEYIIYKDNRFIKEESPYLKFLDSMEFVYLNTKPIKYNKNEGTLIGNYVIQLDSKSLKPIQEETVIESFNLVEEQSNVVEEKINSEDIKIENLEYDKGNFTGSFLNNYDFIAEGSESKVYKSKDGSHVIKISEPYNSKDEDLYKSRITNTLLREIIGNSGLQIIGYYEYKGIKNPVFKQNYVEGKTLSEKEVSDYLKTIKGIIEIENKYYYGYNNKVYVISDFSDNVIQDKQGNIIPIDLDIYEIKDDVIKNKYNEIVSSLNQNNETQVASEQEKSYIEQPKRKSKLSSKRAKADVNIDKDKVNEVKKNCE